MNIILLGAPGAGKGSLTNFILQKKKFYHLSTGNVLRNIAQTQTELGVKVANLLKEGKLVSDDLVNQIVHVAVESLDQDKYPDGIIFDGYPRTIAQAEYLKNVLNIDKVILLDVSDEAIIKRILNRRICPKCNKTYSLIYDELKPKQDNLCDDCNVELIIRKDDEESIIRNRLTIYHKEVEPLINYYDEQKLLVHLDGLLPINEWKKAAFKLIEE